MNRQLPARVDDLPTSLVDVAETLGLRVALSLMEHFGGLEIAFPMKPRPDHPIIKALGATDGHALCHFLGGQSIYVPRRLNSTVAVDVQRLEAQGLDRATIARKLGISQRHVRRVANRSRDDRQADLFD